MAFVFFSFVFLVITPSSYLLHLGFEYMVGKPGFWLDVDQILDQIFGLVFDQGLEQGFWYQKYTVHCTVLQGRRNTVYIPTGTDKYSFTAPPGTCIKNPIC